MAAAVATADLLVLKNTQIIVNVDEALSDILVVSYFNENKRFQGVLLDSTKRNLPFGVSSLHPAFLTSPSVKCPNGTEDKLFSTNQRFAYQDPDYAPKPLSKPKQQQQRTKMTVRLRPRKVLCSKCRGICNENSENVVQTRKWKAAEQQNSAKERKVYLSADSTSRNIDEEESRTIIMGHSLIPKISRLHPNEITNALNGNIYANKCNEIWLRQSEDRSENNFEIVECDDKMKQSDTGEDSSLADRFGKSDIVYSSSEGNNSESRLTEDASFRTEHRKRKMKSSKQDEHGAQRKKRSEVVIPDMDDSSTSLFGSARTLKISYGEGEGTVVKLPASITDYNGEDSDADRCETKAAKKALKKAKKLARRNVTPNSSPPHDTPFHIFQRKHKHKERFNKKKKGPYKEAVNLATIEARADPLATDPLATNTPLSPTPIDVIS